MNSDNVPAEGVNVVGSESTKTFDAIFSGLLDETLHAWIAQQNITRHVQSMYALLFPISSTYKEWTKRWDSTATARSPFERYNQVILLVQLAHDHGILNKMGTPVSNLGDI